MEQKEKFLAGLKEEFKKCYERVQNCELIIYGAGAYGKMMVMAFRDIGMTENIKCICDGNPDKWGGKLLGVPICGIDSIDVNNSIVVIASQYYEDIYKTLCDKGLNVFKRPCYQKMIEEFLFMYVYKTAPINDMGFRIEWFERFNKILADKDFDYEMLFIDQESKDIIEKRIEFYQTGSFNCIMDIKVSEQEYFSKDHFDLTDNEVYVDCGAYDGDSIIDFVNYVGTYKKIYAFEPDKNNYKLLVDNTANIEKIDIMPYGLGKESGEIGFSATANMGSHYDDTQEEKVKIVRLDDMVDDDVSFIKMDIEGFELDALMGAERLIKKYRPKLAICIYHKCEDIITIPVYLKNLVPEYKLKVRQHEDSLFDTVLYAYV